MIEPNGRAASRDAASKAGSLDALRFREAPHNIDAEQALLGAILVNNEAYDRVSSFIEAHHFKVELHQKIYETLSTLIASGRLADWKSVKTAFENAEPIDAVTTAVQYLGTLAANASTIINAREYGRTIHDLWTRRQLIPIAEDLYDAAFNLPVDFSPKELIEETETRLYSLAESDKYGQGFLSFEAFSAAALDMAANAHRRGGGLSGIATELTDLDWKMGGLQPSDLIVLAGRPSMGKTALATNIAFNVARARHRSLTERKELPANDPGRDGAVVGFFSLEMSGEQLTTRILSEQAGIPSEKIRRGGLTPDEFDRFAKTQRELASIPLHIDQTGGLSIAQLAARARKLKRQQDLGLLVVDYLQLMRGTAKRGDNRVQEVSEITTGLKALAKELAIPILALSQLNRAVEAREDKRPQLADLRESGSIEQDADVVLFAFREEYYLERMKPVDENTLEFQDWLAKMTKAKGRADIIIGKQRHGPIGTVHLQFDGNVTRFSNLAYNGQADQARR
jgi:replicative DNA helicase